MKVKNLHEINSVDLINLRTHRFYIDDESIQECKCNKGDYYYLYDPEVQVEYWLRNLGLTGEEKESKRIELLRKNMSSDRYDVDSIIRTYLDSDMNT